MVAESGEQRVGLDDLDFGMAELALVRGFGGAAKLRRHRLHAVADPEQRQPAVEHLARRGRGARQRGRFGPAGQDDALRAEGRDLRRVVIPGPDFAVHADLAHAAGDQLRVLRAEVEDQDLVGVEVGVRLLGHRGVLPLETKKGNSRFPSVACVRTRGNSAVPW